MPRVQGMDANQRRRHRGIFSLSTPFQQSNGTSPRHPHRSGASSSAASENDLDDMEFRGTQTQQEGMPSAHHCHNDDAASTLAFGAIAKNNDRRQQQFEDGMEEDSDATTMDDDDEVGSVDLLADNDNEASSNTKNAAKDAALALSTHSPISPATQTLDRLSKFGSQEDGAELCIRLLATAAESHGKQNENENENERRREDKKKDDKEKSKDTAHDFDENEFKKTATNLNQQKTPVKTSSHTDRQDAVIGRRNDNYNEDDRSKEIQSVSASLKKRQCLHDLKEYFMSTNNSSEFAQKQYDISPPSIIPFCHKCNSNTKHPVSQQQLPLSQQSSMSVTLLHHGLCPKHPDFFNSGSYEILKLMVDGNILQCEACIYQFDHGRMNKALAHGTGCKRGKKSKASKKGGGTASSKKKINEKKAAATENNHTRNSTVKNNKKEAIATATRTTAKRSSSVVEISPLRQRGTSTRPGRAILTPPSESQPKTSHNNNTNKSNNQCPVTSTKQGTGPFPVGTIVFVQDRTWPGRNDPGGVARVCKVHSCQADGTVTYDVKYIIETRRERGVEEKYVSLHTDYVSPTKDCSSTVIDEECTSTSESGGSRPPPASDGVSVNVNIGSSHGETGHVAIGMGGGANIGAGETTKGNQNDHPLSEYEKLRLRNIERNQARLAQLGLLKPSKPSANNAGQSSSNNRVKSQTASEKKRRPTRQMDRRTQPKRRKATSTEEMANAVASRGSNGDNSRNNNEDNVHLEKASLAEAASSGCNKCSAEWKTGMKTTRQHDLNCPRKRTVRHGTAAANEIRQRKKTSLEEEEEEIQRDTSMMQENDKRTVDAHELEKQTPTLMDAAKAGCRKCTMEWQTEEADPAREHDRCCPRERKSASPLKSLRHSESKEKPKGGHLGTTIPSRKRVVVTPKDASSRKATKTPKSTTRNTHRPTPSPVLLQQKKTAPRALTQQPTLPMWIEEFISESNRHNETVPAPRGSKWLPCPNPWGKIGHEEGDVVILSPFESESVFRMLSIFHQGPNGRSIPKRFIANPFGDGSPYHSTHRSPARGGYSVLRLKRDRTSLRPWGFTVRLHDFGGACLVDSIEPLSPADAAQDISGWSGGGSSSGLKLHDMIICLNGKSVGSMSVPELQIELDVCGPELMVVVSRLDIKETVNANHTSSTLEDVAMDWNDIGAGASSLKRKRVTFNDDSHADPNARRDLYEPKVANHSQNSQNRNAEEIDYEEDGSNASSEDDSALDGHNADKNVPRSIEKSNLSAQQNQAMNRSKAANLNPPGQCEPMLRTANKGNEGTNRQSKKSTKGHGNRSRPETKKGKRSGNRCPSGTIGEPKNPQKSSETTRNMKHGSIPTSQYQKHDEKVNDDKGKISPKRAPTQNTRVRNIQNDQIDNEFSSCNSEDDDEGGDENPWLGCVCGNTHPAPIEVFWIQCEGCDAWYNVAEECVGFDERGAKKLETWCCWACSPPVAGLGL